MVVSRPMRQFVATFAVVCFSIVPTAYVGFTAWRIRQSWQVREVESELSRSLACT